MMEHDNFETPVRPSDFDSRGSLRHVLATTEDIHRSGGRAGHDSPAQSLRERQRAGIDSQARRDARPELGSSPNNDDMPQYSSTATTTRRHANGSVSSVYSGNKIRYLKKDDGQPLWRGDIQFAFLRMVFEDDHRVFTKVSDGTTGHTFAEIYTDAMAKSSKCSQVLKEKLLNDHGAAVNMAMICLLVNVGRMNTTLNFFPEMRARVRTYHSIPCLQAHQSSQAAYKQLQDGPRLKSILKGATEDANQPSTIEEIMRHAKPRTNPVNLIFVLSQYAPKISEMHFPPPRDFFDLFTRSSLSSKTRADAFLWLIWWYLESDFSVEATQNNPFGRGTAISESAKPILVPRLDVLNEEDAVAENIDTEEELAFGEAKRLEREVIVANDLPPGSSAPKRNNKPLLEAQHNHQVRGSPYGGTSASDSEGEPHQASRSPSHRHKHTSQEHYRGEFDSQNPGSSPPRIAPRPGNAVRINTLLSEEERAGSPSAQTPNSANRKGAGRVNWPRRTKDSPAIESALPYPANTYQPRHSTVATQTHPFAADPNTAHISPSGVYSPSANGAPPASYFISTMNDANASQLLPTDKSDPRTTRGGPTQQQQQQQQQQRETVHERHKRIVSVLDSNMRSLQRHKRHQRSQRGIVVDAYIKCATLPPDWDSEEDILLHRWAGLDDIHPKDTTNDASSSDDNNNANNSSANSTDVGERAYAFARGLFQVSRLLSGEKPTGVSKKRKRMRRVSERDLTLTHNDAPIAPDPVAKPAANPSRRTRPSAANNNVNVNIDVNGLVDDNATPPPAPALTAGGKKKRIYKRRPVGAAPRPTGPGSRGGKLRGANARAALLAASAKREGEESHDAANGADGGGGGGGGTPGLERSESRDERQGGGGDTPMDDGDGEGDGDGDGEDFDETRLGDVGEQEIDDVDRLLLGEAAADDVDGDVDGAGGFAQQERGEVEGELPRTNAAGVKKALVGYADESEDEASEIGGYARSGGAMSDSDRG